MSEIKDGSSPTPFFKSPQQILQEAIDIHGRDSFYVGFSGGKDSVVATHFTEKYFSDYFKGVIYCDTGIKTSETFDFVKDYCQEQGWRLHIVTPKRSYEEIVLHGGFPQAGMHNIVMRYLKYAPMRRFILDRCDEGMSPAVVSGVRQAESSRRSVNASKETHKDGRLFFVSPVLYMGNGEMYDIFLREKLKRSPVYETLHISGDCLCGCYADKGEAKLVDIFHPDVAQQIRDLEAKVKTHGTEKAKKWNTWGKGNTGMTDSHVQNTIGSELICSECKFDRDTSDDTSILDEIDELDKKLERLH